jgi:hypothetical protein
MHFLPGRNKMSTCSYWFKSYYSIVLIKYVLSVTKKERIKIEENKGRCTLFTARSLQVLLADVGENTT